MHAIFRSADLIHNSDVYRPEAKQLPISIAISKRASNQLVCWVDEIGSSFDVTLKKYEKTGYFTNGRLNVLMHYCLTDGAWLHMYYRGDGVFDIQVKDIHTKDLPCRRPTVVYEMVEKLVKKNHVQAEKIEIQIKEEPETVEDIQNIPAIKCVISLTHKQTVSHNMVFFYSSDSILIYLCIYLLNSHFNFNYFIVIFNFIIKFYRVCQQNLSKKLSKYKGQQIF